MLTRNGTKDQKKNLISATKLSNFVKNDMIVDYLDLLNEKNLTLSSDLNIRRKRSRSDSFGSVISSSDLPNESNQNKKSKSSFDYIVESGYAFEYDIIEQIEIKMKENGELNKLIKINEKDINLNSIITLETIKKNKHTIILNSILINKTNNTWGKPDLIVKGEWIDKYIQDTIIGLDKNKWYIIDIKSSTLSLINGGEDVSSKLLYSVYKAQIYIYTQALNQMMSETKINNSVEYGFILAKKYKFVLNRNTIIKKPFEFLGVIDYKKENLKGNNWDKIISNGVNWINDLRTNWESFTLNPINKDELYPNMKNYYDGNWRKIKKQIALVNKEITLLWNCGIANRKLAWDNNIKNYDNPKLDSNILGFLNSSKEIIINMMLDILRSEKKFHLNKEKNNLMGWQNKSKWEFFVDFETYNNDTIYDEDNEWNDIYTTNQIIYMCGVSWFDSSNNLKHKSFILNYESNQEIKNKFDINKKFDNVKYSDCIFCFGELDLINKFNNFIKSFKPIGMNEKKFYDSTRLIHWSSAEPIIFNKKLKEYDLFEQNYRLNWFDLLKVFKYDEEPIIIKECFGFGLKEIVKKLNDYGEITLSWSDLDDGLLSSFIARDIYNKKCSLDPNNEMYSIIEYNYNDCKALYLLLDWMRNI
jgi:hypothetical protein